MIIFLTSIASELISRGCRTDWLSVTVWCVSEFCVLSQRQRGWMPLHLHQYKLCLFLLIPSQVKWISVVGWVDKQTTQCFSQFSPVPSLSLFPSYIWLYWRSSRYLSIAPLCLVPFVCVYRVFAWPRPLSSATPLFPPTSDSFQSVSSVGYFWFAIWVLNRHIRRWTNSIPPPPDTVYVPCLLTLLTNTKNKNVEFCLASIWSEGLFLHVEEF